MKHGKGNGEMQRPLVFLASDGSGETARRILRSALTQFKIKPEIVTLPNITDAAVRKVVERASRENAPIFFTIVESGIRRHMRRETKKLAVPSVDLLGSSLRMLSKTLKSPPSGKPGLAHRLEKERIRLMSAIDYTLKHDDGREPAGYRDADIILVGVSRSAKSSTAFYLGYSGLKTANYPVHYSSDIPPELLEADANKIIALTIDPSYLSSIRSIRARHLAIESKYTDKREIAQELRYLNFLIRRHRWKTVDVTHKAIEEIAREVGHAANLPVPGFF